MVPISVAELVAPRIFTVGYFQRLYQAGWVVGMFQPWILNSLFMGARVVQEEGIQQDVNITVVVDHAAEYRLQETLPTRFKTRSTMFTLTPKRLQKPI